MCSHLFLFVLFVCGVRFFVVFYIGKWVRTKVEVLLVCTLECVLAKPLQRPRANP